MSRFKFFEESSSTPVNGDITNTKDGQESGGLSSRTIARYRCEQFNTTKVEDHVSFHCTIKKQYLLELWSDDKAKVLLEQYLYKINPDALKESLIATEELEYNKENVLFSLNEDNTIKRIDNFIEIQERWQSFKPKLIQSPFYKTLLQYSAASAQGVLEGGDLEFETEESLKRTYEKSLFYHVLFNDFDHLKDREVKQILNFNSQIFVNIPIELELTHGIIDENEQTMEVMTVGRLKKEKLDNEVLEEQYNKFYKPIIEYNYTEYNYEYMIRRTIDKKTGLIINATARLMEAVKYNYQFITQFDLKKIDE